MNTVADLRHTASATRLPVADDFPILARPVHGRRLAYLDNGATTQKPNAVIEAEARFYRESNANITAVCTGCRNTPPS